mgnify:CR=1 FL=1
MSFLTFPRRTRRPLLTLAAAALLPGGLALAAPVAVPEHVPSDVRAVISVSDATTMFGAISSAPFYAPIEAIFQMPMMKDDPDYQSFQAGVATASTELGYSLSPREFMGGVLKGFDLYVTRAEAETDASAVLVARFADAEKAASTAAFLVGKIASEAGAEPADAMFAGQPGKTAGMAHIVAVNDLLLLGSSAAVVESAITSPGGSNMPAGDGFAGALAKVGADAGQMFGYMENAELSQLQRYMPPEAAASFSGTADGYTMISGAFSASEMSLSSHAWGMEVPASMASLLETPPLPASTLASFAPAGSVMSVSTNIADAATLWKSTMEMAQSNPDMALPALMMQGYDTNLGAMTGLDFEKDMLAAFGPHVVFSITQLAVAPPMIKADLVVALKIADSEKAAKVVELAEAKLLELAKQNAPDPAAVAVQAEAYARTEVRLIPMANNPVFEGVAHAVTADGYWVVGLSRASVKAALEQVANPSTALASNPKVARALAGADANHVVTTLDLSALSATAQMASGLVLGMSGAGPDEVALATQVIQAVNGLGYMVATNSYGADGNSGKLTFVME